MRRIHFVGCLLLLFLGSGFFLPDSPRTEPVEFLVIEEAQNFVAHTEKDAFEIARKVNFLPYSEDESSRNMCGPLSAAILVEAGMLSEDTNVHEFWLLDGDSVEGEAVLEKYFPKSEYDWIRIKESVARIDYAEHPLFLGDWVYVFSGGGSYSHMLTVTKVDSLGRVYSVNNNKKDSRGYVIEEDLLYDPLTKTGFFYEWTDYERGRTFGTSGFGGLLIIRNRDYLKDSPSQYLDSILDTYGGEWSVLIHDEEGSTVYSKNPELRRHPASIVKIAIAAVFKDFMENRDLSPISVKYFNSLIRRTLVISDESAVSTIMEIMDEYRYNYRSKLKEWGLNDTVFSPRRTSSYDVLSLLERIYSGELLSSDGNNILLEYMNEETESDSTLIGSSLRDGAVMYNKRGTIFSDVSIVGDSAVVTFPDGHTYYIYILGRTSSKDNSTYWSLKSAIELFMAEFWILYE